MQLVLSLQAGAMQALGKLASPITNRVERNLPLAQHTIDLLAMIENKTRGNLSDGERRFIQHVLYELRLNYVDELKRPDPAPDSSSAEPEQKADERPDESVNPETVN
ncbi:MAG: DUF1844 domain-containing protein [Chitinivibrionia bacterium]|nr:DUF1844 domain-containing protein [Chitinivibrionia bacterium]